MNINKASRSVHRWATVVVVLPVFIILITGMMLQWKKHAAWIQPPTQRGVAVEPTIPFDQILTIATSVEEAGIDDWRDVDRLDVRPGRGIVKVRSNSRWEIQIDTQTGEVLHSAARRSDLIERLHDGSFFSEGVKLGVFFPSAVVLTLMWATGIYLFLLPYLSRRKRRARTATPPATGTDNRG